MASNRHERNQACRCGRAHADCGALAVGLLSGERVHELAEEIWTASRAWPRDWWWRARMVTATALGCGLLVGLAAAARLGWRMAVLAAWAVGGADLLRGRRDETQRSPPIAGAAKHG